MLIVGVGQNVENVERPCSSTDRPRKRSPPTTDSIFFNGCWVHSVEAPKSAAQVCPSPSILKMKPVSTRQTLAALSTMAS